MRRFLKAITPPVLVSTGRRVERYVQGRGTPPEWEPRPEGWSSHEPFAGWNVESAVMAYRAKLPAFREAISGSDPLGVSTSAAMDIQEPSVGEQNTLLTFAYALSLASRTSDRVSVLDWGGGLGFFSLLSRAVLPPEVVIDFHCKEEALVCRAGGEVLPDVTFWEDDRCLDRRYDLVLASSSLQYSEDWPDVARRLARAARRYLLLTRVPVVFGRPSFVVLQRIRSRSLHTETLCWIVNRDELVDAATSDGSVELVREFLLAGTPSSPAAAPQDETRAYLFRATPR
jgi:putative methyltransferase (TIGR04325 family)